MNNIRSKRSKQIISVYDIPIQLIKDNEILEPLYLNCYGKVYFLDEEDNINIVFIKNETLEKYKIKILEEKI